MPLPSADISGYGQLSRSASSCQDHTGGGRKENSRNILHIVNDYPSVKNGLSRSEAQILTAVDEGSSTLHEAFRACAKMEKRIFMGDSTFQTIADGLASGAHPLMIAPPRESQRSVSPAPVSLTDDGREVLGGRADHVRLNGIDKWMGGVHLTADRCYRWNGELLIVDG